MFDFVTKYRRVVQIILAILILPFAIWGIESYTRIAGGRDAVAKVNGFEITRRELDQQMAQQIEQLPLARLVTSVADAAITPRSVASRLAALEAQKREVSEVRIFGQQYLAQAKVEEAQVKAYYDANPSEFRTPERVRAEYVMLSADALAKQDPVTEAEL